MKKILSLLSAVAVAIPSLMARDYKLVTSADELQAGKYVIITNSDGSKGLSTTQNKNNRGAAEITKNTDGTVTVDESNNIDVQELLLGEESGNRYSFNTGAGYLYAASSSSNNLKTQTTLDDNGRATIKFDNLVPTIEFTGKYTRNLLQYNLSSNLFSCYSSRQKDVAIYQEYVAGEEAAAVEKPVIEVAGVQPYFKGDVLSVTIGCETEGAEIYYTTDGTEPTAENGTKYEGSAVNVTSAEAGDVIIKAIAVKDADKSKVATRTVTFGDCVNVASVEEFEAQAEETVVRLNFPLTVTYATYRNIFAQDETGNGIWLFAYGSTFSDEDAVNYPNGSVIAAGAIGATTDYRGNKELGFGDYADRFKALAVTAGDEVTAETVTFPLKAEHLYKLIAVEEVAVAATSDSKKYDISGVELYNNFGITMPTDLEGNKYDITGVCVISNEYYAIYPISIVEHTNTGVGASRIDGGVSIKAAEGAVMVNGADGKVVVFDAMGRVVKSVSAKGEATVEMPAGYYIVRTAGVAKAVIVK